jgi:hypothetical protein
VKTEFLEPRLPDPEPAEEDYEVEVTQSGTIKDSVVCLKVMRYL